MAHTTRIPREIALYIIYIRLTDNRQLSIDPATTFARYLNWGWSPAQSAAWTAFRVAADLIYVNWSNEKLRSSNDTDGLHLIIDQTVAYDDANHVLNKVANSNMPPAALIDYGIFNCVRDTPLEDMVKSALKGDVSFIPTIYMKKIGTLFQKLGYKNGTKKSVAIPDNVKEIQVFQAVKLEGDVTPFIDADYSQVGAVKRGSFTAVFLTPQVKGTASHKLRYKFKDGTYSNFCGALNELIS